MQHVPLFETLALGAFEWQRPVCMVKVGKAIVRTPALPVCPRKEKGMT